VHSRTGVGACASACELRYERFRRLLAQQRRSTPLGARSAAAAADAACERRTRAAPASCRVSLAGAGAAAVQRVAASASSAPRALTRTRRASAVRRRSALHSRAGRAAVHEVWRRRARACAESSRFLERISEASAVRLSCVHALRSVQHPVRSSPTRHAHRSWAAAVIVDQAPLVPAASAALRAALHAALWLCQSST
jgi:hypothetical protein